MQGNCQHRGEEVSGTRGTGRRSLVCLVGRSAWLPAGVPAPTRSQEVVCLGSSDVFPSVTFQWPFVHLKGKRRNSQANK